MSVLVENERYANLCVQVVSVTYARILLKNIVKKQYSTAFTL